MRATRQRKREKITEAREIDIISIIDAWDPSEAPFTREGLVRRVKLKLGLEYSRQGLMKRDAIRAAFERRTKEVGGHAQPRSDKEPVTVTLERRYEGLRAKLAMQEEVIQRYKELFLTYRHNARQLGIRRDQLEAPILPRQQAEGSRG